VIRADTIRRSPVDRPRSTSSRFASRSRRRVTSGSRVINRALISPQGSPSAPAPRKIRITLYWAWEIPTVFKRPLTWRVSMSAVRIKLR